MSFNGKLCDKCLNLELFTRMTEARVVIGDYREHLAVDENANLASIFTAASSVPCANSRDSGMSRYLAGQSLEIMPTPRHRAAVALWKHVAR